MWGVLLLVYDLTMEITLAKGRGSSSEMGWVLSSVYDLTMEITLAIGVVTPMAKGHDPYG